MPAPPSMDQRPSVVTRSSAMPTMRSSQPSPSPPTSDVQHLPHTHHCPIAEGDGEARLHELADQALMAASCPYINRHLEQLRDAAAACALDAKEQNVEAAAACGSDASASQQHALMLGLASNTDGVSGNQGDKDATADEVDLMQLILHDGPPQAATAEGRLGQPQQRSKRSKLSKREHPACSSW